MCVCELGASSGQANAGPLQASLHLHVSGLHLRVIRADRQAQHASPERHHLQDALTSLRQDRTTIIVAHRFV
jgi:hypothetical protein